MTFEFLMCLFPAPFFPGRSGGGRLLMPLEFLMLSFVPHDFLASFCWLIMTFELLMCFWLLMIF